MDSAILRQLNAARRARKAVILVTDLSDGSAQLIGEAERPEGRLREEAIARFLSGRSGLVELDGRSFFFNVHLPAPRIVAIGAVHITQALNAMAGPAGFDLTIIDPRTAFATPERFAGADLVAEWPEEVLARRPLDRFTALVAVTHDPKIDDLAIAEALKVESFYVGALGSRKTHAKRIERLGALGVGPAAIARISAPIGLDIGAATPGEIAVAILADIIAALRHRSLSPAAQAEASA